MYSKSLNSQRRFRGVERTGKMATRCNTLLLRCCNRETKPQKNYRRLKREDDWATWHLEDMGTF